MSGTKVLLDTNFILGMLKSTPEVLAVIASRDLLADELSRFAYLSITPAIEDAAIDIRRKRRVKLPDALIAATALVHGLNLLTLDTGLMALLASVSGGPADV